MYEHIFAQVTLNSDLRNFFPRRIFSDLLEMSFYYLEPRMKLLRSVFQMWATFCLTNRKLKNRF
jgi:hypothetical protein